MGEPLTTAAAERRALGAKAQGLLRAMGDAGERRALTFARAVAGTPAQTLSFAQIAAAPAWLARERTEQRAFARRVAVVSMADHVAAAIDGEWLARVARAVGDEAMDRAVAAAGQGAACAMPPVDADKLEARGFAVLQGALPAELDGLIAWAPVDPALKVDRATALNCVQLAEATTA